MDSHKILANAYVKQSIDCAVLAVWHEFGLSIERLGRLERIEYRAQSEVFEFFTVKAAVSYAPEDPVVQS